jgi:hypothetical protein
MGQKRLQKYELIKNVPNVSETGFVHQPESCLKFIYHLAFNPPPLRYGRAGI